MKKILRNFALVVVAALSAVACSQVDDINESITFDSDSVILYAAAPSESSATKVTFTENAESNIDLAWESTDTFTLYDGDTFIDTFTCISASDGKFAASNISTSLVSGTTYTAKYNEGVTLESQNGDDISKLSNACQMEATFVYGEADVISFEHTMAIMTFEFTSDNAPAKLIFENGDDVYTVTYSTIGPSSDVYTSYIMIEPCSAVERTLTFILYDSSDVAYDVRSVESSVAYNAGYRYTATVSTLTKAPWTGLGTEADPFQISTVADMTQLASEVNNATIYSDKYFALTQSIDMSDAGAWSPIGGATIGWSSNVLTISGNAFKGVFDGKGFALKNLNLAYSDGGGSTTATYGLFGVLDGATIKNLVIGAASEDSSALALTITGTGILDTGVIAGVANESTITDCTSYASMTYNGGTRSTRVTMAMVGFIFCKTTPTTLDNLVNYGKMSAPTNGNTGAGATAVQIAGICGFATNDSSSTVCNVVSNSTNNGDMEVCASRCSGIVAAANRYTTVDTCVNNGDQMNKFGTSGGGRLGNITCITGAGSSLKDCINYGDLVSTTSARCGGLLSLVDNDSCTFSGCANYGMVITDASSYRGLFFGYNVKTSTWDSCIAGGSVGSYNNGDYVYDSYDEVDQKKYLGPSSDNPTFTNITYAVDVVE